MWPFPLPVTKHMHETERQVNPPVVMVEGLPLNAVSQEKELEAQALWGISPGTPACGRRRGDELHRGAREHCGSVGLS